MKTGSSPSTSKYINVYGQRAVGSYVTTSSSWHCHERIIYPLLRDLPDYFLQLAGWGGGLEAVARGSTASCYHRFSSSRSFQAMNAQKHTHVQEHAF